ncbi:DNA polymerase III [Adhaeribacter sp. BT258]|uniref:DNA polymerase III n=1 Tax=Adhaeribacter terrigena TaxID=2793070 RepID=A0ABS1C2A6_9BACT|nr:exonuclease domain-containing protein [Adhaeribacter terrigena]MBK0403470.1 DNA polymerase III [Adhaeribacter terrigena]
MDFVTIDFETATSERDSPCEIGLTYVKNKEIVGTESWLIKPKSYPYFNPFNISIHGIRPEDVANQPEFHELWSEIKSKLENQLVIAHNASFDFSVLRKTLTTYDLPFPNLNYACSYIFSKKVWTGLASYDLKTLCWYNNINLNHHRAAADSRACAELTLKAFELTNTNSVHEFQEKLKISIGELFEGGYRPAESKGSSTKKDLAIIAGDPAKRKHESIFYGNSVVFTGTLTSMSRAQAQQLIADIGGINAPSVTKTTNFLVVGQQDYKVVGEDGMSSKQEKAVKLIEQGSFLEVISEKEFLCNI